jgi:3'(2'), 5'-bisphosphate nucleotidase
MTSDVELARRIARQAGELVLDIRTATGLGPMLGEPGDEERLARKSLRDRADRAAHDYLLGELTRHRPGDAVLSEEGVDDPVRLTAQRLWIVDPVDGTWEYGQSREDFAVHVALWDRTADALIAGALAIPSAGITYDSAHPISVSPELPTDRPVRIVISRSRPPRRLAEILVGLSALLPRHDIETYSVGSAGAKTAEVLAGRADAYIHDAGLSEWDVAAPASVALAAGLHVSHFNGDSIRYNAPAPLVGDLVIATRAVAGPLLNLI